MLREGESTIGERVLWSSALVCPMTTLNRDAVPIGDDIESVVECRVDVETGNKEKQEPEDCGHAVYRGLCAVCVKGRCVGKHLQVEPLEEEERERTTPIVAFGCVFLTQENSDISNPDLSGQQTWPNPTSGRSHQRS